jgi:aminopeptidase N
MLALAALARRGRKLVLPATVSRVVGELLGNTARDRAQTALALTLPDPSYVAALEPMLDVDGVMTAWRFMRRELARAHRTAFESVYASHRSGKAYAFDSVQAGMRRLANACLAYLGALDDRGARALAIAQYESSDNMTDAAGALHAIKDSASPERDDLYARFEARWRDEPLVLDKWFMMQAKSLRDDTLETVRRLLVHPRFNARNPNRVRSLVGAFTLGNFERFHAIDGSGYAFAAEQVLALDRTNPQLASTVACAFNLWKRTSGTRRGMMQAALARIAQAPDLSPDVTEIVTRTLED